ncbi:adenosylcobinamide-GDP ribazoletransferase [Clostridium sp. P21]|uniref:Adenosylcobinamide-GDP ribazoletransferase n=1 Tax=Clostridium muellerianum TaxID=2716538 RepID=A0A7Y0EHI2_9CLOT|nr:adenosylcobinamide-GDP ribazoletransferase [Clostridium muellerianum]NMM63207.1 adenosylcobinamide-GDP ribazoletransferase [Clostridium muellerianum]
MKKIFSSFLLIIQFFTRIPVNMNLPCEMQDFKRGSVFLPIIGLIIGTIQWIVYKAFVNILPVDVTVVLVILVGVIVTGGFHIDGLGDTFDGFFAFKGNEKIIEIMKDSRIGTYACIATIMNFLFRYSLLTYIAPKMSIVIILSPTISRFCTVFIAFIGNTAKSTGTGNFLISNVGKKQLFISLIMTLGVLSLIISWKYVVILMISGVIFTFMFNLFCKSKIGGLTGDTLGASNELNEILVLIIITAIVKNFVI